jgi:ATP-binding cassette subfamily B protein
MPELARPRQSASPVSSGSPSSAGEQGSPVAAPGRPAKGSPVPAGMLSLLKPYSWLIALLVVLTILGNGLNLVLPKLISSGIDDYVKHTLVLRALVIEFFVVGLCIFVLTYLQSIVQTYASERVAKDLRTKLAAKISVQTYAYIEKVTPAKLLTNLTSDVDAVKLFVSQAIATIISSVFLIIGASVLLLSINWRLALAILGIVPIIGATMNFTMLTIRKLFKRGQEAIDKLNRIITESIMGAALVRLLNTQLPETEKFRATNAEARDISLGILRVLASIIPIITLAVNLATVLILLLGGHFVIAGGMTLGNFAAFNSYLAILVFPIMLIGFMSNVIAQANAAYERLSVVVTAEDARDPGRLRATLRGDIALENVELAFGEKKALRNVSLAIRAGTRNAIVGPTAAGKTQLLHLLIGLIQPTAGTVTYDGQPVEDYDKESLHHQIGFVFQDSVMFNLTLRENIAFGSSVREEDLEKAIQTAELKDFIDTLPQGLNTVVSERGTSLSGGQKQRVMLARALALNPKVLLLDDFTARVDTATEQAIIANVQKFYPGITLLSVTQKIASVEHYDQIVLLMEGEILAAGTHPQLMEESPEYVQLYDSQRSTSHYEVHA